jgi:hypothetical protein
MATEDLDEEEAALLAKHRADKRKAAEEDKETWIRQGDNEAAVPYSKAKGWLQKTFGIDLDAEPVQDPPEPGKPKPDAKPGEGDPVKRFVAGRRVS